MFENISEASSYDEAFLVLDGVSRIKNQEYREEIGALICIFAILNCKYTVQIIQFCVTIIR